MRKVLIISPRFPPKNSADMQRVRTSLPFFQKYGWGPTVLCVSARTSDVIDDFDLQKTVPPDVVVHCVDAWSERVCRRFGFGQLGYRSLFPLFFAGTRLLRQHRYDVVFFSTTVFLVFLLGPIWKAWFGVKIVYDIQDPWYAGDVPIYTRETSPGGWRKYRFDQWLARVFERFALKAADRIISVSDGYVSMLSRRYPFLSPSMFTTIPFGGAGDDYRYAAPISAPFLNASDKGVFKIVSVGRSGPDMVPLLRVLFKMISGSADEKIARALKLYFVGTNYAPAERTQKFVEPVAYECGVGDIVEEHSVRIPYLAGLALYRSCDAILLCGSMQRDYTASKFFNCVLSGRPILALFHKDSLISRLATQFPNVFLVTFGNSPEEQDFEQGIKKGLEWIKTAKYDEKVIEQRMLPWRAETLTASQCRVFDLAIAPDAARELVRE